jgi:O-antigen/teichoic acid export membrane protein
LEKEDLKKIRSGGKWTALGAVVGVLSQLAILLGLALLLSPEDVGFFAIFLFVLGIGITVLPLGNDFSFVQAERLSRADIIRMVGLGGVLVALFLSSAFVVLKPLSNVSEGVSAAITFGTLVGFAEAIFLVFSAALQRNLDFRSIESANIARQLLTFALSLALLAITRQVEAAYIGRLLANLLSCVMLIKPLSRVLGRGRPQQPILSSVARDMLLKNVLGHFSRNAEIVAGSPQLGVAGLGIYDLGRRFVAQPRDFIGSILFKFTFPVFSKISKIADPKKKRRFMRRTYGDVIALAAFAGFPVFAVVLLLADPLITDIFGSEWRSAIYVVQIFALTAFIQILGNNIITSALTATGGSNIVLKAEYLLIAPRLIGVYGASFHGPVAIAIVMSVFIIAKLIWMQRELNKLTDLSFGLVAKASRVIFAATLTGFTVSLPVKLAAWSVTGALLSSLLFSAVYVAVLWWARFPALRIAGSQLTVLLRRGEVLQRPL